MSKKNSNNGTGLIILIVFLVGFVVIIGALLLWPLYNIYNYISARISVSMYMRNLGEKPESDLFQKFSVDNDDKKRLAELMHSASKDMESINNLKAILASLGDLKKNKDGSYSQRSAIGKQAYHLDNQISDYNYELRQIKYDIESILNKPKLLWRLWKDRMVQYRANKNAVLSMLIIFPLWFYFLGMLEGQNFIYGIYLYVYASFILPSQILGNITGLYIISLPALKEFSEPFQQGFTWQLWTTTMLPVPIFTYFIYKISKIALTSLIEKKVPEPGLYNPDERYGPQ